jgi:hypothetical protein
MNVLIVDISFLRQLGPALSMRALALTTVRAPAPKGRGDLCWGTASLWTQAFTRSATPGFGVEGYS